MPLKKKPGLGADEENKENPPKRIKREALCQKYGSGQCRCDKCCTGTPKHVTSALVNKKENVNKTEATIIKDSGVLECNKMKSGLTLEQEIMEADSMIDKELATFRNIDSNKPQIKPMPPEVPEPVRKPVKKFPPPLSEMLHLIKRPACPPLAPAEVKPPKPESTENGIFRRYRDWDDPRPCCSKFLRPNNFGLPSRRPTTTTRLAPWLRLFIIGSNPKIPMTALLDLLKMGPKHVVPGFNRDYLNLKTSAEDDIFWRLGFAKCSKGHFYKVKDDLRCTFCGEHTFRT